MHNLHIIIIYRRSLPRAHRVPAITALIAAMANGTEMRDDERAALVFVTYADISVNGQEP